jgi:hypothetical protein
MDNKIVPVGVTMHSKSKKTFWVFLMNNELSDLLEKWTKNKNNMEMKAI